MGRVVTDFLRDCGKTLKFVPYLNLCAGKILVFNVFIRIASFQSYIIIYYMFGGDAKTGSKLVGHSGLLGAISTLGVIVFVTWLGTKICKRRAFSVTTGISMLGHRLKWVGYNPDYLWLILIPAPLIEFGLGGLFTVTPSMIADVVDVDELEARRSWGHFVVSRGFRDIPFRPGARTRVRGDIPFRPAALRLIQLRRGPTMRLSYGRYGMSPLRTECPLYGMSPNRVKAPDWH